MATVGRVVIEVDADTAKFIRKLDSSSKRMKRWGVGLKRFAGQALRRFSQGLAAGVAALGAMTLAGVKMGDQLAKTAAKLGTTAGALEGLRFAAQQTGVETRQLDLGIQRMTRRISEAAKGMGEAQGAIVELGLSAKDLARQPIEQQFLTIADAMGKVESGSDRIRLGFKLFDSEGVSLINTLAKGRDGLQEFFDRSKELGLYLTNTQTRVVQESADAMGELGSSFKGLSLQLGAAFGPALESAAQFLTTFVTGITAAIPEMKAFLSSVFGIRDAVNDLTISMIEAEVAALQPLLDAASAAVRANRLLMDGPVVGKQRLGVETSLNKSLAEQATLRERINKLSDERFNRLVERAGSAADETVKEKDALQEIEATYQRMILLKPKVKLLDPTEISKATESMRGFGDQVSSGFANAIVSGQKLSGVFKGIAADLAAMVIKQAIFNSISGIFGGVFGAGGIPALAHGGTATAGKPHLVGERGPEIFVPKVTGTVIPNGGMGGGVTVVNNTVLNVTSADDPNDLRREVATAIALQSQQTISRVRDLIQRGRF